MKTFIFAAVAVAFLQVVSGDVCNFDPVYACDHCDFSKSYVQYVANPCNCTEYYSCEKTRGFITAHKQACAKCLCFSDKTWGCTIYTNEEDCPFVPPVTEKIHHHGDECCREGDGYIQKYREALGDHQYTHYLWMVFGAPVEMPCPPGTYFNFDECQCVNCFGFQPCADPVREPIMCLDWEDWFTSKKLYYQPDGSCTVSPPYAGSFDHILELDGDHCDVEIPWFQKNEFSQFTFCGSFKATRNGPAGLAFDGGRPSDDCNPSISIELDSNNHLVGGIYTGTPFHVVNYTPIQLNQWYQTCLRYDGSNLELTVLQGGSGTSVSVPAWGNTEMNRCNMLLGASVNQNDGEYNFFQGEFGTWCFSRAYFDPIPSDFLPSSYIG